MLHEWTLDFKYVARPQFHGLYGDSSEETGHECDSPAFLRVRSECLSVHTRLGRPENQIYMKQLYRKPMHTMHIIYVIYTVCSAIQTH